MASESEYIDFRPSKEAYRSFQFDVTPITAIKELIDNTIDNAKRVEGSPNPIQVDIELNEEEDKFIIKDNSGGLEESKLHVLFSLGKSTTKDIDEPIGSYGVGAKKAIVKLGRSAMIKTRHMDSDRGYGFVIDEDWLSSDNWTAEKMEFDDIETGNTVIEISELKDNLNEIRDSLEENLGQTYELFLGSRATSVDLIISINGREVVDTGSPDWSFTPFDSLHPRRFENIRINRPDMDYPVFLHVTVGLLTKGSSDRGGTDVFCQKRKVLDSNTGRRGGYGGGPSDITGLAPGQLRLKVILEFETEGDADKLPWDTQKNDIDLYNPIIQEAYIDWFSRIVKPYYRATYGNVPGPFTEPYRGDHPHAENKGEIISYNYKNRKNIVHSPDTSFSEINEVIETVETHVKLGIKCVEAIDPEKQAAYEKRLDNEKEDSQELILLESLPEKIRLEVVHQKLVKADNIARNHAAEEVRLNTSDKWWYPYYLAKLQEYCEDDVDELATLDDTAPEFEEEEEAEDDKDSDDEEDNESEDENEDVEYREEEEEDEEGIEENDEDDSSDTDESSRETSIDEILSIAIESGNVDDLRAVLSDDVIQKHEKEISRLKQEKETLEQEKREAEEQLELERRGRVEEMQAVVDDFELKLDQGKVEKEYQNVLKENPWFFGTQYEEIDDEVDPWPEDQNDFLIKRTDTYHDVVELKRPDDDVFLAHDPNTISTALRDALCQVARYLHHYRTRYLAAQDILPHKILNPRGIIVIGRNEGQATREKLEILKTVLDGKIEILTYNDLVDIGRNTVNHYENTEGNSIE